MSRNKTVPGFSDRLLEAINKKGLPIASVAYYAGVSNTALYNYLYHDTAPSIIAVYKLCKMLKVSADWLLFGDEVPTWN